MHYCFYRKMYCGMAYQVLLGFSFQKGSRCACRMERYHAPIQGQVSRPQMDESFWIFSPVISVPCFQSSFLWHLSCGLILLKNFDIIPSPPSPPSVLKVNLAYNAFFPIVHWMPHSTEIKLYFYSNYYTFIHIIKYVKCLSITITLGKWLRCCK